MYCKTRKSEESVLDILKTAGSINTEFGGKEVLHSLADAVKFPILTCCAAALLILRTSNSRPPYSQPHQKGMEPNW